MLIPLDLELLPETGPIKTSFFHLGTGGSALPSFLSSRLIQHTFVLERLLVQCSRRYMLINFRVEIERKKKEYHCFKIVVVVQLLCRVQPFTIPWTAACQVSLSITNSQSFAQTHVHGVHDAIQPSRPL